MLRGELIPVGLGTWNFENNRAQPTDPSSIGQKGVLREGATLRERDNRLEVRPSLSNQADIPTLLTAFPNVVGAPPYHLGPCPQWWVLILKHVLSAPL